MRSWGAVSTQHNAPTQCPMLAGMMGYPTKHRNPSSVTNGLSWKVGCVWVS